MGSDSVDVCEFNLCDIVTEMTVKNGTVWLRVKLEDSRRVPERLEQARERLPKSM